ncbi:Zinc ribbon domain-containing protein, partial [Dysosmobacter welbionis]
MVLQQLHLDPGRLIGCRHTVQFLGCDAAVIFVNDNCSHKFASFKSRLQRPENGNEDHGYDENDHRQPQAGAEEVHELQVARTDDQGVGAAAHRGQERSGCCHTDGDGHGGGVHAKCLHDGNEQRGDQHGTGGVHHGIG